MTCLWHDPYSESDRFPQGAVPAGSVVRLRLKVRGKCERAYARLWRNEKEELIPMRLIAPYTYEALISAETRGLLWYFFICDFEDRRVFAGKPQGEVCADYSWEPPSFQITVYDAGFETPAWMRGSIMMQIMPDRFFIGGTPVAPHGRGAYLHASWHETPDIRIPGPDKDGEAIDFFGGNLAGITEKLPYLKALGIGALYLNPIFRARSNHKYDTADYLAVDPSFGTDADLKNLLRQSEKAGIRVILDGVFSHTGADSRYFNKFGTYSAPGAYAPEPSPYDSWYRFGKDKDDYDCWWGIDTLPNVNEMDPSYLNFIIRNEDSVVARYLQMGASGWRLDVADELPMDFIRELRRRVKAEGRRNAVIGEVWEDPTNKIAYGKHRSYALGDTLDSAMNYPLRDAVIAFYTHQIDAYQLAESLNHQLSTLPKPMLYSMMNLLSSHDRPRIINMLSGAREPELPREQRKYTPLTKVQYETGKERYIQAWKFICALPGMPTIYYGDEAGLTGWGDPFCRLPYPWGREDRQLVQAIAEINGARNRSQALKTGLTRVRALNAEEIEVSRYIKNDLDAFGLPASNAEENMIFRR